MTRMEFECWYVQVVKLMTGQTVAPVENKDIKEDVNRFERTCNHKQQTDTWCGLPMVQNPEDIKRDQSFLD